MRWYFAMSLVISLTACGGNTKQDLTCSGEDARKQWYQRGYDTAMAGDNIRTFEKLKEQCGDPMARETRTAFIDGYTQGALEFCTYDKGYSLGYENFDMPSVCPFEIRADFVKGYRDGSLAYMDQIKRFEKAQDDFTDEAERAKRINDANRARQSAR
ncbi:putative lipoprotein [Teredinibacter turnerae T7901]|uniref:Lipoprotein n=2 Tax=Teredinibacter turnerae TaxID=2426 RepID=C5BPW4_TERTT|nr:putative lipoprotein [Teredinibacter turnerae T7901]